MREVLATSDCCFRWPLKGL